MQPLGACIQAQAFDSDKFVEWKGKKTGVSSTNIPWTLCLILLNYLLRSQYIAFENFLSAPGKPQRKKSSFSFAPGYPKNLTGGEKKSVHGKIRISQVYHCYFITQITVTLAPC